MIDNQTEGTFKVVRIATITEHLAGPFRALIHAKRWITQHANQTELFDDDPQPELFL